ncbi:MAG: hypothetical protein L0Z50_39045 [Verrucomicrobiales bacterium]|nr:hypothetical protein [Verrucomicrobiales bacterium]
MRKRLVVKAVNLPEHRLAERRQRGQMAEFRRGDEDVLAVRFAVAAELDLGERVELFEGEAGEAGLLEVLIHLLQPSERLLGGYDS